jgi:chorismate dehydratase
VGAVSYLNTKPLIYGLEQGLMKDKVELVMDYPANIAAALINNDIDLGLVPVAIIPDLKTAEIISDYCISCDGEVGSVCLFSEVPIDEIERVLLDYQSRTSVELARLLINDYWKIDPFIEKGGIDLRTKISGTTAAVIIGDRAFEQKKKSTYSYDLGLAWKQHTGLPFVFATWVSNKQLAPEFIEGFNQANEYGLAHIDKIVRQNPYEFFDLEAYYTRFINYRLGAANRQGLKEFLKKLAQRKLNEIPFS